MQGNISVDVSDDAEVAVSFEAILEYGKSAPAIFDRVVNTVCKTIPELKFIHLIVFLISLLILCCDVVG